MQRQTSILWLVATLLCLGTSGLTHADDIDAAWSKLRNGSAVAIMRHALAPGFSDPAGFDVDDCSTQRNLSEEGRTQARKIGQLFRDQGIDAAQVISSQWCRCVDTADLLDLGTVATLPALNSFFENRSVADAQTEALRAALVEWIQPGSTPSVLVTHQVNIRALTQTSTSSGEILIVTLDDDQMTVLASIPTL